MSCDRACEPRPPDAGLDASFLDALIKAGITIKSDAGAVKAGKAACGMMAQGRAGTRRHRARDAAESGFGHDQGGAVHCDRGERLLPAIPATRRRPVAATPRPTTRLDVGDAAASGRPWCCFAPPRHWARDTGAAEPNTGRKFPRRAERAGITFSNPKPLSTRPRPRATMMDQGQAEIDVIQLVTEQNPGISTISAAKFTAIAASAYCPQHLPPRHRQRRRPESPSPGDGMGVSRGQQEVDGAGGQW